jgi:outer membrane protein assembly factor BamB
MHDIEHKSEQDDSAIEVTPLQPQEEPTFTPGTTMTRRQKLPRAWRYAIAGGIVLLVLAVISAGILSLTRPKVNQSSPARPTSVTQSSTLPTPATTPIKSPVSTGHNVSMTIADGVAYLGTDDNVVYALRISTGALLWRHKIEGSVDVQPLVANGVVYVTSFVGQYGPAYVYALRASDGNLLWTYSSDSYSYLSLSTTDSSVAYIASQERISALNASNGTKLWHHAIQGSAYWSPLEVNGIVYVGSSTNSWPSTLYALQVSDGALLWQYTANNFIATPTVANGVVYTASDDGVLAALRASDGHQLWKQALDTNSFQSPQLVNGVLYATTTKIIEPPAARTANPLQQTTALGALLWNTLQNAPAEPKKPHKQGVSSIYAVRASDGAILWHYTLGNSLNSWTNWFSVEHGVVYASAFNTTGPGTEEGHIYALQSTNGSVLWHDQLNATPYGALLANGVIYLSTSIGSYAGAVYAVRMSDGSLLWTYPISGIMFDAPVLDGTTLYVGAANGMVYALQAGNGALRWHYLTQVQP